MGMSHEYSMNIYLPGGYDLNNSPKNSLKNCLFRATYIGKLTSVLFIVYSKSVYIEAME